MRRSGDVSDRRTYSPVVSLVIRLLGAPSIEVDGAPVRPPRGRKSWAVLAYVLLAERPPSRHRLASLLFADADDPLGALRWTLAEVRRSLRPFGELVGDPVAVRFSDEVSVSIDALAMSGSAPREVHEGQLLEGMSFDGCEAFETWLLVERRRLGALVEGVLHEEALRDLAAGHCAHAVTIASLLVSLNPLEETFQELLVRCLAASGEHAAAIEQALKCKKLFLRELGVEPSPAVRRAADVSPGSISQPLRVGPAAARAQLDAGRAAISAGAVDSGLDCIRRAAVESQSAGDRHLHVQALVELGGALVHAVRGRDEEGAAILHEALASATDLGDVGAATKACRELGFIDVQAGRRERADAWLRDAESLAQGDDGELAAILGVRGMNLSDCARYPEALVVLEDSVDRADRSGARRQQAWSMSLIGRLHHLRGWDAEARSVLDTCLGLVRDERWTAFSPWPETLVADVDLADQRTEEARDRYAHAFALACQLADPCWEGVAAKGLAMVEARAGETAKALTWLIEAHTRCTRWPDTYHWVHASVLDATADFLIEARDERGADYVEQLASLASRTGMREFVIRSHIHRARLGQSGALEVAVIGVAQVDNPVLATLVEEVAFSRRFQAATESLGQD